MGGVWFLSGYRVGELLDNFEEFFHVVGCGVDAVGEAFSLGLLNAHVVGPEACFVNGSVRGVLGDAPSLLESVAVGGSELWGVPAGMF